VSHSGRVEMGDQMIQVVLKCPADGRIARRQVWPDDSVYCHECGRRLTGADCVAKEVQPWGTVML
jgi:hypothetical protein